MKVEEKEVGLDQVGHWDRGVSVSNFAASPALTDSRPNNIEGLDFPICHHQQGRIDFNTVNPSLSRGKDFLIHSL